MVNQNVATLRNHQLSAGWLSQINTFIEEINFVLTACGVRCEEIE
jgi:hypothetical protein